MSFNGAEVLWPEDFVVAWTDLVAKTFRLEQENGWVKKPFRPGLAPVWLRGPLLSYTDLPADGHPEIVVNGTCPPGRFRFFSLSATQAEIEGGQPVVMRMKLAGCTEDDIFKNSLSSGCRNRLRKSLKSGIEFHWIEPGVDISPAWGVLEAIHQRLGSPLFPRLLLSRLHEQRIARVGIVRSEGEPVAMLVLIVAGDIAWIPWCGALASHHRSSPNHLSHWEAIRLALELGCEVFDFGRSAYLGGTYEFKRKWGALPVPVVELTQDGVRSAIVNYRLSSIFSSSWQKLPICISSRLGPLVIRALAL